MARESLADEAARLAEEHWPGLENFEKRWAYQAAYEALERRLREAVHRGVVVRGVGASNEKQGELDYWYETARIAHEKVLALAEDNDIEEPPSNEDLLDVLGLLLNSAYEPNTEEEEQWLQPKLDRGAAMIAYLEGRSKTWKTDVEEVDVWH